MPPIKIGPILVGIALVPLLGIAAIWQFSSSDTAGASRSQDAGSSSSASSSVGALRNAKLELLTREYISSNENVSSRIQAGKELAPVDFLNRVLERDGEMWRVRQIDGLIASTYDVS